MFDDVIHDSSLDLLPFSFDVCDTPTMHTHHHTTCAKHIAQRYMRWTRAV
jgi:hypothetical protein